MNEIVVTRQDELRRIVADEIKKALAASEPTTKTTPGKEVFTNKQAMKYLSVSRSTLQRWRNEGKLPYRQVEGKIFYTREDLESLLNAAAK